MYMHSKYNNVFDENISGGKNFYKTDENTFLSGFPTLSKKFIFLNTRSYRYHPRLFPKCDD